MVASAMEHLEPDEVFGLVATQAPNEHLQACPQCQADYSRMRELFRPLEAQPAIRLPAVQRAEQPRQSAVNPDAYAGRPRDARSSQQRHYEDEGVDIWRSPWLYAGIGALALLLAAGGFFFLRSRGGDSPAPQVSPTAGIATVPPAATPGGEDAPATLPATPDQITPDQAAPPEQTGPPEQQPTAAATVEQQGAPGNGSQGKARYTAELTSVKPDWPVLKIKVAVSDGVATVKLARAFANEYAKEQSLKIGGTALQLKLDPREPNNPKWIGEVKVAAGDQVELRLEGAQGSAVYVGNIEPVKP